MSKVLFWVIKFMVLLIMFTGMIILTHYVCSVLGITVLETPLGRIFFYGILLIVYSQCIDYRLSKFIYHILEKFNK